MIRFFSYFYLEVRLHIKKTNYYPCRDENLCSRQNWKRPVWSAGSTFWGGTPLEKSPVNSKNRNTLTRTNQFTTMRNQFCPRIDLSSSKEARVQDRNYHIVVQNFSTLLKSLETVCEQSISGTAKNNLSEFFTKISHLIQIPTNFLKSYTKFSKKFTCNSR